MLADASWFLWIGLGLSLTVQVVAYFALANRPPSLSRLVAAFVLLGFSGFFSGSLFFSTMSLAIAVSALVSLVVAWILFSKENKRYFVSRGVGFPKR